MSDYVTYATGAKGSKDAHGKRYDLISGIALEWLAEVMGDGAETYGDRDWEKGIAANECTSRAMRHLAKHHDGDTSEDHLGHAFARIMMAMHSLKKWPELNGVPTGNKLVVSREKIDPTAVQKVKELLKSSCCSISPSEPPATTFYSNHDPT